MREAVRLLFLINIYSEVAHRAMRSQYQRIVRADPPQLSDGYLFALALADLLRAAKEAAQALPAAAPDIAADMQALPDVTDFRNLLQHWPDYAKGRGRDADRLGRSHGLVRGKAWFHWDKLDPPTLRIGGSPGGLLLNVEDAKRAGAALFQTVHSAVRTATLQSR